MIDTYRHAVLRTSPPRTIAVLVAALLAGTGCTSMSTGEVESGLQRLRFYPNMYVVQAGDTLETVAFRYRLAPAELAALNPGSGTGLRPGMRINVRPGTQLSAEVRAAAKVARGPATLATGPGAAAAANAARPAPSVRAGAAVDDGTTRIVATAPATTQPAPVQSEAIVIEPAVFSDGTGGASAGRVSGWDAATGGYPNEELVPDDLGPQPSATAPQPDAGFAPVPSADAAGWTEGWVWPTEGQVARGFAPERVGGQGIDIAGRPGQDVRAAAAGTVIYSGKDPAGTGGSLVILKHADELMTTYSHADKLFVAEDDVVRAGDPIASLGANEAAESVLSFEVRRGGAPLDPIGFIGAR